MIRICAFTGHRPTRFTFKYDEAAPACIELKNVLAEQIARFYRRGVTKYLTGCALGVDMWAGEAVLALAKLHPEISLCCIVPFAGQEKKWTPEQQMRYNALLQRSSKTVIIKDRYTDDCYFERNRFLVDNADALLAVYDGEAKERSGTGYTVRYAQSAEKPILLIHPDTLKIYVSK